METCSTRQGCHAEIGAAGTLNPNTPKLIRFFVVQIGGKECSFFHFKMILEILMFRICSCALVLGHPCIQPSVCVLDFGDPSILHSVSSLDSGDTFVLH